MVPVAAAAPARLGRYELLARIATGGMGEIFLARLEGVAGFEKLYVIKRILPHLADDARFRQMLVEEARVTSKMAHANICQVIELGETNNQLYIVMEHLEGVTLLPLLRQASKDQRPLDFGFVGGVLSQVCDALHYAHELRERNGENLGVVHRDVTPSNVFLTESGVAKVLDFGIAKVKTAGVSTQTGTVKGKYAYMAPEQLRGHAIDRRVDVFALGIVMYEMLALRRLFQRKTDYLTFRAVMEQPVPDVRRYRPDLPEALARVVETALDREPDRRFASARVFREALLDGLGGKRPWSQSDLGEYVHAHFATELGRRSHQVASAIQRTDALAGIPSGLGRTTMPLIANDEPDLSIDAELDDEFPCVEETMDEMPVALRIEQRRAETAPTAFVESTPPPFGADSATSGASLQPIQPGTQGGAPARRGWVWPVVVVVGLLVAGAVAVVIVLSKGAAPPAQAPIVIQQYPAGQPDPGSAEAAPDAAAAPIGSGSATSKVTSPPPPPPPPRLSGELYQRALNAAIDRLKPKLVDCVAKHGKPPAGTVMSLAISLEGRARSVSFKPVDPDPAFATCVQQVMTGTAYPKPSVDWVQEVTLRAR